MSNNSFPAADGGEIGRAQAAQAEACGVDAITDMNPILLKPESDSSSQVVIQGKVWKTLPAREYYQHVPFLRERALESFHRLASSYDYVVMEGAGSVAEVNLRQWDIVNLGFAGLVNASALLVADIDRGGVFAQLIGTMQLLEPKEAALVKTFAVNRFRGDVSLFADGVRFLEERMDRPCLGVFPMAWEIRLDEEDGVAVEGARPGGATTAIICLPRISNLTDFDQLDAADWITTPVRRLYDTIILPGTKNTVADLEWLRERGLDTWILRQHAAGAQVIGVCGGYQMLGRGITEDGVTAKGLGLLPVDTLMQPEKTVRRVRASVDGAGFDAYEIHVGETRVDAGSTPFALLEDGRAEGVRHGRCAGTYLHDALRAAPVMASLGLAARAEGRSRDEQYNALANWFDTSANTRLFEKLFL